MPGPSPAAPELGSTILHPQPQTPRPPPRAMLLEDRAPLALQLRCLSHKLEPSSCPVSWALHPSCIHGPLPPTPRSPRWWVPATATRPFLPRGIRAPPRCSRRAFPFTLLSLSPGAGAGDPLPPGLPGGGRAGLGSVEPPPSRSPAARAGCLLWWGVVPEGCPGLTQPGG